MSKIYFQGTFGAYSHLAALSIDPKAEILPCKTFDDCFNKASEEPDSRIIIPESNRITGNIGIEYLIFKHRLNIYKDHFQKIEHNLLGQPGAKLKDIKEVYSHAQGLSQCSGPLGSDTGYNAHMFRSKIVDIRIALRRFFCLVHSSLPAGLAKDIIRNMGRMANTPHGTTQSKMIPREQQIYPSLSNSSDFILNITNRATRRTTVEIIPPSTQWRNHWSE